MVFMASIVFSHLAAAGRDDLQSLHFGGIGLGIAASAALMAILVAGHAGWTAGWFWSAAISAVGFAVVARLVDQGPATNGVLGPEPPLPKNGSLPRIIVAYGLFGFGYVVTATFLITIVRQGGGGRVFEPIVWMATGLAGFPSVWLWQKIAAKAGLYRAYAAACLVEAAGVAASVALGGHIGPIVGGVLLGFTFIAATALGLQAGRLLAPLALRRLFALMTASFGVGQIVGPIAAGYLAEWSGSFFIPSMVAAAVLAVSAAIVWSAAPVRR
jgi:predicted MFS family arabinose efflux permease